METSYCAPLQLQDSYSPSWFESLLEKPYDGLACDPASDPGYFSAGSSLSPTSSVDTFCFSPTALQMAGNEESTLDCFLFGGMEVSCQKQQQQQNLPCPRSSSSDLNGVQSKRSRSRYRGRKRQTASEREKLRMRDLTKALHHLRTYLPPSVAPAGQTLTKIETLRLTMRYISYLSAQLGLSEEVLEQRRCCDFGQQPQTLSQILAQPAAGFSLQGPGCSVQQTQAAHVSSFQVAPGVCYGSEQYWTPQQRPQNASFPAQ